MQRKPAVAGMFYEGTEKALRSQVAAYIPSKAEKVDALGVVAPHAGYLYSGSVAGAVYSGIQPGDTFLILGPNHTGLGAEASLFSQGAWEFPLGKVDIDEELAEDLLVNSRDIVRDTLAHQSEHSIEVQVPFLQYLFRDFKILPLCLGPLDLNRCLNIGRVIAQAVKRTKKKIVLISSTDMSHYVSREIASKKDGMALAAMEKRDPVQLYEVVRNNHISMCGVIPTVCLMAACNDMGAKEAALVKYSTSGDVTGDFSRVVAYAGMIIK